MVLNINTKVINSPITPSKMVLLKIILMPFAQSKDGAYWVALEIMD